MSAAPEPFVPVPVPIPVPDARPKGGRAWVERLDLLRVAPCTALEALSVAVYLFALAFAVFGAHLASSAFMFDDWTLVYDVRRSLESGGFLGAVRDLYSGDVVSGNMPGRPTAAFHYALEHWLLGDSVALHVAFAIALAALVALLFYVALRRLGLESLHAGAIATLVLLFPAADSTVFWPTGAIAHATVALYLAGLLCALRALRASGWHAVALHALALAFYAASVLQYQIAAPFVFLSIFLYRFSGASWRRSLRPWIADVAVGLAALGYVKTHLERATGSISDNFTHARNIAGAARRLLESLGVQGGPRLLPTVATLLLFLVAGAAAVLLPREDAVRAQLRRWLLVAAAGIVSVAAAYAVFVPGNSYYWPLQLGIGNRVNAAAALGFALVLYASAMLAALLVARALRVRRAVRAASVVAAVGMVFVGSYFAWQIQVDRRPYAEAADLQRHAVDVLRNDVAKPAPGTTVYLFGIESEVAPNVFTFVRSNDVTAVLRLLWNDDTIRGVPVSSTSADLPGNTKANSGLSCDGAGVTPHGWLFAGATPSPYEKTLFVDVQSGTSALVGARDACASMLARYGAPS